MLHEIQTWGGRYTETVFIGNTNLDIPPDDVVRHLMPMGYLARLSELRKRKKLTQAELASLVGVEQPTVQRWEAGKREPDFAQLFRLAEALDVSPGTLIEPEIAAPMGPRLFVKGEVVAGVWREAFELPADQWETFTGRADVLADLDHRFGLRVIGDSMNTIYPEGTILDCVSTFGHAEVAPGKRVIVVRTNLDGETEATVKELQEQDGELWLVPRSHNPMHLPFKLGDEAPGIVETRIAAVVVGAYMPE